MRLIALTIIMLAMSGCMTTEPVLKPGQKGHITEVTVTKFAQSLGTRNLAEDVRVKTLTEAYRFPEEGPAKALKIHIEGVVGVSPARAALVSNGSSYIIAKATLVDVATGKATEPMSVMAMHRRFSGLIGLAESWGVDSIEDERLLATQLAENIMVQIYGEDAAINVVARAPRKKVVANYPFTDKEEQLRLECDYIRVGNEAILADAKEAGDDNPQVQAYPPACEALWAKDS